MAQQIQPKCFGHLKHMINNLQLKKRCYLIMFGHTEALLLKKNDIKRPFFPPCTNWPIYVDMHMNICIYTISKSYPTIISTSEASPTEMLQKNILPQPLWRRFVLVGLVSAGFSCGKPGQPGIYHRCTASASKSGVQILGSLSPILGLSKSAANKLKQILGYGNSHKQMLVLPEGLEILVLFMVGYCFIIWA